MRSTERHRHERGMRKGWGCRSDKSDATPRVGQGKASVDKLDGWILNENELF